MEQAIDNTLPALSETVRARPRSLSATLPVGTRPSAVAFTPNSEVSTRTALRAHGLSRLRVMAATMVLLTLLGAAIVGLVDGPVLMKRLAWSALALLGFCFGWIWHRLEAGALSEDSTVIRFAIPVAISVVMANFAFGLASAFPAAVTLGLLLFASSVNARPAAITYGIIATGYAVSAVVAQWLGQGLQPLLPLHMKEGWHWALALVSVELLYAAAYSAGRVMRREQARIVQEFERAVREAGKRAALLAEAREALKQGAGLGGPGRFTDQEIDGFRLGPVIGRGGMGEVYEALRLSDGEPSALKLLRVELWGEKQALARFAREAKIVASIDSPHVVRVLEVSGPDSVCPYIAMERLAGMDLGTYLRERSGMNVEEVSELVEQVAAGLDVAHAASIVHRDLKPQNLFRACGSRGIVTWKILDFGVSKLLEPGEASLTAAEIIGTPQYMAPEQARGERDLDGRVDVYALSAIVYRALTGEAPFRGDIHSILRAILEEMPEAASARARIPADVDLVLAIGLAKRREDRFDTARDFAQAFAQAARNELDPELRSRARGLLSANPYRIR